MTGSVHGRFTVHVAFKAREDFRKGLPIFEFYCKEVLNSDRPPTTGWLIMECTIERKWSEDTLKQVKQSVEELKARVKAETGVEARTAWKFDAYT